MTDDIKAAVKAHAHPNTIYHALYGYFFLDMTMTALARIYCKSRATISNWISRYETNGAVGRAEAQKRAKKFGDSQRIWLYNYFMAHPAS